MQPDEHAPRVKPDIQPTHHAPVSPEGVKQLSGSTSEELSIHLDPINTDVELLVMQYKLIEDRRKYFGTLFWQFATVFQAVFTVFLGVSGSTQLRLPWIEYLIGGLLFLLIAYIAHRLRQGQDECEKTAEFIEQRLRLEGCSKIVRLPHSSKFGARTYVVLALVLSGLSLIATAAYHFKHPDEYRSPHAQPSLLRRI